MDIADAFGQVGLDEREIEPIEDQVHIQLVGIARLHATHEVECFDRTTGKFTVQGHGTGLLRPVGMETDVADRLVLDANTVGTEITSEYRLAVDIEHLTIATDPPAYGRPLQQRCDVVEVHLVQRERHHFRRILRKHPIQRDPLVPIEEDQ